MLVAQTKKFALLGYPLAHSLSPVVHQMFAKQFNLDLIYELHSVLPEDLFSFITVFFSKGGCGLNITAPYKELVCQQLTHLSPKAKMAGAVNTIFLSKNGEICGDNTDGDGLIFDLKRHSIPINGKKVLILGAGGAVRGILQPLLSLVPSAITLVNRDLVKAELLAHQYSAASDITVRSYSELPLIQPDVIIHAISSEPKKNIMPNYAKINFLNTYCYDLNYTNEAIFTAMARAKGAQLAINGIGMLVEQAAQAFFIWNNHVPNTDMVLAQLQQITG